MAQFVLLCGVNATSFIRRPGNLNVAAFLPIYKSMETGPKDCSNHLDFKRVVETLAIMYAVNEVNLDAQLLSNFTMGYDIETGCARTPELVLTSVNALLKRHENEKPPVAMLLDLPQLLTQLVATFKSQNIPVLSFGSIPANRQGDVFYLEPAQPRLSDAILKLIQQFNWTLLDVLVDNAKEYELFKSSIKTAGTICVNNAFHSNQNISDISYDSKAPALLVFSKTLQIFKQLPSSFLRGREIVLISDSLDVSKNRSRSDYPAIIAVGKKRAQLQKFQDYFFASAKRNASWLGGILGNESRGSQGCSSDGNDACGSLPDRLSNELEHAGKAIDAVYAVAHGALKEAESTSDFTSPTGNSIRFTASKDLWEVDYGVYNLAKMHTVLAGSIKTFPKSNKTVAELNVGKIEWNTETRGHPNSSCAISCPEGVIPFPSEGPFPKCCVTCPENNSTVCKKGRKLNMDGTRCVAARVDYLRPRHPFSIVIMIMVAILFCFLIYLVNIFVKKAQTPTILTTKLATVPLLLSLFVTLIIPLLPILKPSPSACNAYVFGYVQGLGIPLCILISRSHSYSKRFRTEDGTLKKKLCRGDPQNIIAVVLILIELILSLIFLFICPAHVISFETDVPDMDYIECSMFSRGVFLFPFCYPIFLTIIFSVKNFQAITREEDIYESNFAALSIFAYYFLSFLTLIVLYGVNGKTKIMLVCLIAFFHVLNYILLIFFPKVYVIVFKRDPSSFSPFPLPIVQRLEVVEFLIPDESTNE